jgi:hypothetical protein
MDRWLARIVSVVVPAGRQISGAAAPRQPSRLGALNTAGRSWWTGALIILAFAGCFLQFADIGSRSPPANQRVNNGNRPTFFALHLNPYYLFSEDFHLYFVRAKRIMTRGWSDSLLFAPDEQGKNYAAPLQAALGMIAASTGGEPLPYALFLTSVLVAAWLLLYAASRAALPASVSRLNLLLAVLVTVLFEGLQFLGRPHTEFYQWPVARGLRTSTLAWSNPLLVAVLLCGASLAFRRRSSPGVWGCLAIGLTALALSDNWAFMLAWGATGLVWLMVVSGAIYSRIDLCRMQCARPLSLGLVLFFTLAAFAAQTGALRGDALARAGMGPQWQIPGTWIAAVNRELMRDYLLGAAALLAVSLVTIRASLAGRGLGLWLSAKWNRWTQVRLQITATAWMPILAGMAIVAVFSWIGTDPYHARQFTWRIDYCLLYGVLLLVLEGARRLVVRSWLPPPRARLVELGVAMVCVAALLGYHQRRIHRFIKNTASREYYLTRDEEQLHDWLNDYSRGRGRYSLATASPELNLLCAYWTDADLWLPSGFPYHCASSRERLEQRTADLVRLYNASPQRWLSFNMHMHADDQWSWAQSRVLSARQGYMYYLLHREVWLHGYPGGPALGQVRIPAPKGSTERVARTHALQRAAYVTASMKSIEVDESKEATAQFLAERAAHSPAYEWLDRVGGLRSWSPQASVESAQRIAAYIDHPTSAVPAPDVILVDDVSRALGTPDLSAYELAFRSPSIEAWVKSQPQGNFASRPGEDRRSPR